MSAIEYNNLLFKTSQRLNELNVGRQLLVMCRGNEAGRGRAYGVDAFLSSPEQAFFTIGFAQTNQ